MNVTQPTRADHIYRPAARTPPPIPPGGSRCSWCRRTPAPAAAAFPLAVAPGDNQALWFEIDTGDRPPGRYRGRIAVRADQQAVDVPIELEVLPFALPAAPSLTAMVYFESDQVRLYQGRADLEPAYHRFAHRQRIELVEGYDRPGVPPAEAIPLDRFGGSDFIPSARYAGPGQGVGNRVVPATFYGPGGGWEDRAQAWKRADAWMDFVTQRLSSAITFLYLPDEPAEDQFPEIVAFARQLKANPGPGGKLPLLVTHHPHAGLAGAVDIWVSIAGALRSRGGRPRAGRRPPALVL